LKECHQKRGSGKGRKGEREGWKVADVVDGKGDEFADEGFKEVEG